MPAFSIQDPYPERLIEAEDPNSDSEFEVDSDISDADAQEFLKQLEAIDFATPPRGLADATLYLLEITWKRWSDYCRLFKHPDPQKVLRKADNRFFCGYLLWYQKRHKQAKRLNIYESLWKCLRQLYYEKEKRQMPDDIGKRVIDYLHGEFCEKFSLIRGMK